MNIHDATEQAYKNGYEKGYSEGKQDLITQLLKAIRDDDEINGWNFARIKMHILELED